VTLPAVPEPREIAELETAAEAKELYDKIETLAQYARRYRLDHAKQNQIAEAKLRTARKGGQLLAADESLAHGKNASRDARRLPDGMTWSMSSRWQTLASVPEEKWEQSIAHALATPNDELTLDRMVRIGREAKLGGRAEARERKAVADARRRRPSTTLEVADIRTWRPAGVTAIITDPPYVGDALPLYEALRDFAADVLPAGGALAVMTWQPILPDVLRALDHPDLAYRWCIAWRYDNAAATTADYTRRVHDRWKPILVYHRGGMPSDARMFADEITSPAPDKRHHKWGQSLDGFRTLVRAFAEPGQLVCDPFLGGGTTALAALAQGRRFVGCDIDPAAVATAEARLA
jgi:site-specific DNA-methyltransferase (adenine-specific)